MRFGYVITVLLILSSGTIIIPSIQAENYIPSWIKNNAKWWSTGQIEDSDFTKGIQWLLQNKVIIISQNASNQTPTKEKQIPSWIKNNAGWWANNKISDDGFVKGIQYLVQVDIIHLDQRTSTVKTFAVSASDDETLFQYCTKYQNSLLQKYNATADTTKQLEDKLVQVDKQLKNNSIEDIANAKAPILIQLGRYDEAFALLDKALQTNPNNFNVLETKYQILTSIGEDQKALPVADKLVSIWSGQEGEEHVYMDQKAILLIRLGQYDGAGILIDEASKRDTYDVPTPSYDYLLKMIIAEKQGNHDLANTYFELLKTSSHLALSSQDKMDFNKTKIAALSLIGDSKEVLKNIDSMSLNPDDVLRAKITACEQVINTYKYHHPLS